MLCTVATSGLLFTDSSCICSWRSYQQSEQKVSAYSCESAPRVSDRVPVCKCRPLPSVSRSTGSLPLQISRLSPSGPLQIEQPPPVPLNPVVQLPSPCIKQSSPSINLHRYISCTFRTLHPSFTTIASHPAPPSDSDAQARILQRCDKLRYRSFRPSESSSSAVAPCGLVSHSPARQASKPIGIGCSVSLRGVELVTVSDDHHNRRPRHRLRESRHRDARSLQVQFNCEKQEGAAACGATSQAPGYLDELSKLTGFVQREDSGGHFITRCPRQ